MTRYQALRKMGCGILTAGTISFLNSVQNVPEGTIYFLHMIIEYEVNDE